MNLRRSACSRISTWGWLCLILLLSRMPARGGPGEQQGDDWPTLRHDAQNTGYTHHNLRVPLRLAWRFHAAARYDREPMLLESGGVVCVSGEQHNTASISLLDAEGHLLWQMPGCTPIYLRGDTLIVVRLDRAARTSSILCYHWPTKRQLWSYPLEDRSLTGAVTADGKLYCLCNLNPRTNTEATAVIALNLVNGKPIAQHQGEGGWGSGGPTCDGNTLCYGTGHWLHVMDARTLEPQFAFADGGNCYLIRYGNLLIAKGWMHYVHAWNLTTRKEAWRIGGPRDVVHCLARGKQGNMVLIESSSARDLATGKTVWNAQVYAHCAAGAGKNVYLAGVRYYLDSSPQAKGGFYGLDASTGKILWRYERPELKGIAVIISGGNLFGLGADSYLYKFVPVGSRAVGGRTGRK